MQREKKYTHKIALLATGDEVCAGDIVNSNSQEIALRLTSKGMKVRMHMSAPDTIHEIETAIQFLLSTHDALIITGGLGPTSDDLTRYGLAHVLQRELIFDKETWNAICARLKRFGYATPPESNRQQALFPAGAEIIPNLKGTAAGCMISHDNKIIFMLSGPPDECLSMIDEVVLEKLQKANFSQILFYKKWLLLGVSEGRIAEELDKLAEPFDCTTGYRLAYPYIEFKVYGNKKDEFDALVKLAESAVQSYIIDDGQVAASTLLQEKLKKTAYSLDVIDFATGGLLEATLKVPEITSLINFNQKLKSLPENTIQIEIVGLEEFWTNQKECTQTNLKIIFNQLDEINLSIPFRGQHVKNYAVELICREILKVLENDKVQITKNVLS